MDNAEHIYCFIHVVRLLHQTGMFEPASWEMVIVIYGHWEFEIIGTANITTYTIMFLLIGMPLTVTTKMLCIICGHMFSI